MSVLAVSCAQAIDQAEAIRVARRGAAQMGVEFGTLDQRRPVVQQDSGVWIVSTDKLFILLTDAGQCFSLRHRVSPPEWEHEPIAEGALTEEQVVTKAKEYASRMGVNTSNLVLREFQDTRKIMQTVTLVPEIGGHPSVEGITVSLNRMNGSLISIGTGLIGRTFDPAPIALSRREAAERIVEQITADRPNAPKFTQREPLPTLADIAQGLTLAYRTPSKNLGDRARRANQERRLRLCYDYSDAHFAISLDAENGDINDLATSQQAHGKSLQHHLQKRS